jgi:CRISPR system Cascade subunit CasA
VANFNLGDELWIPVLSGGQRVDVSIAEAIVRAHELDGLALDEPLQAAAILRQVLLPMLWSAIGVPRSEAEWATRWQGGRFDEAKVRTYLSEHADRLDLFHPSQPFAQVGGLRTVNNETKPVSLLLPAAATGNNVPLYSARTEADPPPLTPAEAARALLATHCWDTAAIKSGAADDPKVNSGKTTGNPTGPLGALGIVIPIGQTLFETLMLNTPILRQGLAGKDRPQWNEVANPAWRARSALGLLDLLTWQSRRIRLFPETDERGRTVVRRVVVAAGDRLTPLPEIEPHTAWRRVDKPRPGDPPRRPIRHQPGRALWRGMTALLATRPEHEQAVTAPVLLGQIADLQAEDNLPVDLPMQVLAVGVLYGNQSAVVEDVLIDTIPLPIAALSPDSQVRRLLLDVVDQAERLRDAANGLSDDLRQAAGGEKLPWDKGLRLGEILVNEFTPVVRRMLGGLQREPGRVDDAESGWKNVARRLAVEVAEPELAAAPPTAFLGRQVTDRYAHRLSTAEVRYRGKIHSILGAELGTPGAIR